MRTVVNEVEVPNTTQKLLDERAIPVLIAGSTGTALVQPSSPNGLPVFITGGTSVASVTFSGSITTDIGDVKIIDFEANQAVIPHAGGGKAPDTHALIVQHIDPEGVPIYQSTQVSIMQNQGTLATQATLAQLGQTLVTVMDNQGTLATQATLAQISGGLTVVMNGQGTLATFAKQSEQTGLLAAMYLEQGTLATTAGVAAIANGQGTLATFAKQTEQTGLLAATYLEQGTLATKAGLSAIVNNQGTLATQATLSQVGQTLTKVMNNQGTLAENSEDRDAFGRLRVSEVYTLFDSKHLLDAAPHLWDDGTTSGSGAASAYDRVNAKVRLSVSASTAGTRTRRTFRRFNYQPGKSQLIFMTFTMGSAATGITRRVGYFDAYNGLFLEQTASGASIVIRKNGLNTTVAQASWNIDALDGNGTSGVTLDLTKSQIFYVDFEWLGVGTVNFGFIIGGRYVPCHQARHANVVTDVYMSSPNLPLSYEISNDGSGAAAALDCICSSVMSEGGSQNTGFPRSVDRGLTPFVTLNDTNLNPILGLRLSSAGTYATVSPVGATVVCTSNAVIRYAILVNPVISGDAVTWTGIANSAVEFANATDSAGVANVATGGTVVASGYAAAAQASTQIIPPNFFGLGSSLRGVQDEVWLCAARITGTTESIYGSIYFTAQS